MLGQHLTLDFYDCNKGDLDSFDFIHNILDELPDLIGMKKLTKPSLTVYDGNAESFDKGGISGFVIIAESHISIHTFKEQNYASIDIFSCKDFDIDKTINYLVNKLGSNRFEKNLINRGNHFPKDVKLAESIVNTQRSKIQKR